YHCYDGDRQAVTGRDLLTGVCVFFFFFQAEDGIRDKLVTGVQTCALPISLPKPSCSDLPASSSRCARVTPIVRVAPSTVIVTLRSEERRVGKECRSGWGACHEKKK